MFKLRRKNKPALPVYVTAAQLQPGDRIVYDTVEIEVLDNIQNLDNNTRRVRVRSVHRPKLYQRTWQVELFEHMLICVNR